MILMITLQISHLGNGNVNNMAVMPTSAPRVVKQREGAPIDLVDPLIGIPLRSRTIKLIKRKRTNRKKIMKVENKA